MESGGLLFYDMTSVISYSKNLKLAEKGYNADHEYENQVKVIMAFSVKSWVPVAVDVFYGSVKDIKSLGYFIDRLHDRDMGFIMDRGLFSESIIKDLRRMKMHYIVLLRRNSTLVPDRVKFDSAFVYNGRQIVLKKIVKARICVHVSGSNDEGGGGIINSEGCCIL
jgi:transposase